MITDNTIDSATHTLFLYHTLVALVVSLAFIVLLHMLYRRRTPSSIIAWVLSIVLIPYVAIPLYFIIGSRKRENRYKRSSLTLKNRTTNESIQNSVDAVLRNYGISDATKNIEFKLLFDPLDTYDELLKCINNAQHSIYISAYIVEYDKVTKEIFKALIKKAHDGVKIKILIDSLGSFFLYIFSSRVKELREAGVQIEFFMPLFEMPLRNYINLRNHRKIYIFDDEKIISGGANLSHEYLGESKNQWEDIMFFIKGESVEQFFEIFASDWFYASGEKLKFKKSKGDLHGNIFLQVVPSGPDMDKDIFYEALLFAIYGAKEKIRIITPYFIPNHTLIQALIIAHHKGVDVKLITPKEANHTVVNLARSSYMRELEEAGIEIYLYDKKMLHAKAILFDDECVVLGSVNFDNRSLFLNYEVATFIYSKDTIKEVQEWSERLMLNSSFGTKEVSDIRRVFENMMRILAPQL